MAQVLVTARAGALLPTPSEGDDRLNGPSRPALDPVPSALGTLGNPVVAIFYPDQSSKRGMETSQTILALGSGTPWNSSGR